MTKQLWLPTTARDDLITARKEPAPTSGNKFGVWSGRDLSYLQLPGGALMAFDLSKLTLQDFRQMRDHYQVAISLYLLAFMMHQIDWRIEGDGTKQQRDWIDSVIRNVWTELIRGFCQAHWAGFSPMVIDWQNGTPAQPSRIGIERIKDLVPEDCFVNWKVELGQPQKNGYRPRFWEYDGIMQFAPGPWVSTSGDHPTGGMDPIPASNTIWYSLLMENGDYYGKKLLRPAFAPWFFSTLMHLFSNRYYERFGEPVPIGRADFDAEVDMDDGRTLNGRDAMFEILDNIRSRSSIVLPSERVPWGDGSKSDYGFDIQYLESQMRGVDFERYLGRLDEEISLSLFTPLLMTRVTSNGATNNAAEVHSQAFLWMLNALAGDIRTYINKYVIDPLREFNWGTNAPKMTFESRPLGRDNAELLRALVMETVRTGMARPDLTQMGEAIGLDFTAITSLIQAPGAKPGIINDETTGNPAGNTAPQPDNRTGRPMRTTPKGLQKQIAARVQRQLEKHRVRGDGKFNASIGYSRQVAEALGIEPKELAPTYTRMSHWLSEVAASDLAVSEVMTYFGNLVDHELVAAA